MATLSGSRKDLIKRAAMRRSGMQSDEPSRQKNVSDTLRGRLGQDIRTIGEKSRGKPVFRAGSDVAQRGGGPQFGRPRRSEQGKAMMRTGMADEGFKPGSHPVAKGVRRQVESGKRSELPPGLQRAAQALKNNPDSNKGPVFRTQPVGKPVRVKMDDKDSPIKRAAKRRMGG